MQARRFRSSAFPLTVDVQEEAYDSMVADCRESTKRETGGVLIGRYSKGGTKAEILEALSPPLDSVSTKSTFLRGISGLSEELASRWKATESYYVGEWHYHPLGDGQPSGRDISQMIDFAKDADMQAPVPVLVIVFPLAREEHELHVFVFTQDGRTLVLDPVREAKREAND